MSFLDRIRKEARGEPLRAALYARFSSDNQRNESIDAQVRAIKEFAEAHNILLVAEYIDRAKSATTDDRPEFQRMVEESAQGNFRLVIVHKLDRFSRNRYDSIAYKRELKRNRVNLISVLEPLDEDSPESVILESVLDGMAEFYSKNLAREVRKGLKENALKCKHTGGRPPLGYDVDAETRRLVINPIEAAAVKIIYSMVLAGCGYNEILSRLNSKGYKTKANRDFGKNSLYEILRNRKYTGVFIYNRSAVADPYTKRRNNHSQRSAEDMITIPNGIPVIIPEDEFDRVQRILAQRRRHSCNAKHHKEAYLLTGKVFCGECGCRYSGNRKNSTGNRVPNITYRCNNRARRTGRACHSREVNRDYLESFVLRQIEKAVFNKHMADHLLRRFREYIAVKQMERNEVFQRLEKQIAELERREDNLSDLLATGVVNQMEKAALLKKLGKIESEKLDLMEQLEVEKTALHINVPSRDELMNCFKKARALFMNKELEDQQQLVDMFVEKITVYQDEVEVVLNLVSFVYRQDFTQMRKVIDRDSLKETFSTL